ncbi:MAG: DUF3047 domain-containing protein [Methylococcales bacterium]|nr:DUF3047 domain-containing protein [Methylococcales bacterium]
MPASKIRVIYALLFINTAVWAGEPPEKLMVGLFSSGSLADWQTKEFTGQTQYQIVDLAGSRVLKAQSDASASGLFKGQRIDLQKTPFMNWRWRIENRLLNANEQIKAGDDYAARIYVVVSGGLAFWQTKAVNYVWASSSPVGKIWPNAYAGDHAMMVALRSARDQTSTWYTEKRDVRADLKQLLGVDGNFIDAVAIMTDTDNTHGKATAFYGDIYFSKN